ncbi:hypothetical protein [Streptomyces zaomyceticus]|uniref:hypothetical protein n=1 Tax=Streptomyces zaomyceticus TaxID=68286 RepID=UPI00368422AD
MHADNLSYDEAVRIVKEMIDKTFKTEFLMALPVTVRPLASARISTLVAGTKKYAADPLARTTAITRMISHIIRLGIDNGRVKRMIEHVNDMHDRSGVEDEDRIYILSILVVWQRRMIDLYGWRRLTPVEVNALVVTYEVIGRRMHLECMPGTYEDYEHFVDGYERQHFREEQINIQMAGLVLTQIRAMSGGIGGRIALAVQLYSMDELLRKSIGYPALRPVSRAVARAVIRLRRMALRLFRGKGWHPARLAT